MKRSRSRRGGIRITYEVGKRGITSFEVAGHAGFAAAGSDIVCAAVSALVASATYGLRAHCELRPAVEDRPGRYRLSISPTSRKAQAVLATMLSGLQAIARSYPGYVSVRRSMHRPPGSVRRRAKADSP